MMKSKSVCAVMLACLGASACSPGWMPFGFHAKTHDELVIATPTYQQALAALESQDFEGALLRFQSLNRSYRESPAALNGMAIAYAGMGETTKARFMFETALIADPQDTMALDGVNRLLAMTDDLPSQPKIASSEPMELTGATELTAAQSAPAALPSMADETLPKVVVLNGNGRIGNASRYATILARADIVVDEIASADRFDYPRTTIRYRPGLQDSASAVARSIGLDAMLVEASDDRGEIVIVLGADAA